MGVWGAIYILALLVTLVLLIIGIVFLFMKNRKANKIFKASGIVFALAIASLILSSDNGFWYTTFILAFLSMSALLVSSLIALFMKNGKAKKIFKVSGIVFAVTILSLILTLAFDDNTATQITSTSSQKEESNRGVKKAEEAKKEAEAKKKAEAEAKKKAEAEAKKKAEAEAKKKAEAEAKKKAEAEAKKKAEAEAKKKAEAEAKKKAEEAEKETFGMNIIEFKTMWEQATTKSGMEDLHAFSNDKFLEAKDSIIFKSQINEYIYLQATLDPINEEIKDISLVTVPPEGNQTTISTNIILATGVLVSVLQPELTADERGDIVINNLGLGLEDTDLKTVNNEYVLNDVSYVLRNMEGLLYFGVIAGDIDELRKKQENN
ncbi:cell envelope integrity protein TolA [Priestia sp. YIM B13486]|uniref:cell envelope integrity protein TolA n=1 Tax=Priestia sp. YIM B13486 TaxID=3366304 RepID=UPI00366BA54D